jgi:hypothetical protein
MLKKKSIRTPGISVFEVFSYLKGREGGMFFNRIAGIPG